VRYGAGAEQVADVWLPGGGADGAVGGADGVGGAGVPLVVFLHGGFWRAAYDRVHARSLAVGLAAAGYAVALPEYRRTGQAGGGWPGTFDDVALAVDTVPGLAGVAGPVVLAGHSAGGHLALWAAARGRLPSDSPWSVSFSTVSGVVGLAAVSDLTACADQDLGRGAAHALMGGGPGRRAERYAVADPARLLPPAVPVRLVHGADDGIVPSQMSVGFARRAVASGGQAGCDVLPDCGHFELIDPQSAAWPAVLAAVRSLAAPGASAATLHPGA
jgi:acetyl esterase/lipase